MSLDESAPFLTVRIPARHLLAAQKIVFGKALDVSLLDKDVMIVEVGKKEVRTLSTDAFCFLLSRTLVESGDSDILWTHEGNRICPDPQKPFRFSIPASSLRMFKFLFKGPMAKGSALIEVFPDMRVRISNESCISRDDLRYNGPATPSKYLSVTIEAVTRLGPPSEEPTICYTHLFYSATEANWATIVPCDTSSLSKLLNAKRTLLGISPKTSCFIGLVPKTGNVILVPISENAFGGFSTPILPATEERLLTWATVPVE